jgi:uncharacterized membrane protein
MKVLFVLIMPWVLAIVGSPMAWRMVPPNRFWGVRLPFTMASTHAWYETNALAGRTLVVASLVGALVDIPFVFWPASLDEDARTLIAVGCVTLIVMGSLLLSVRVAYRRYGPGSPES